MSSSADPTPASENTHVVVLTMETPFGLMHVTSPPMRVSEASMTAADYATHYVDGKQPYQSKILNATIQRK
jgi:hypothetical protein